LSAIAHKFYKIPSAWPRLFAANLDQLEDPDISALPNCKFNPRKLTLAKSHNVDVHVGARMRQRRALLGMSQSKVGEAVGLTFQQIQKYERGSNRIGSSRLYEFAKVLDVPVSYFFDEMPSNALSGRPMSGRGRKGFGEAGTPFEQEKDPLIKRETLELVRAYYKIREGRVRKRIFEMVKAVGAASHAEVLGGRKKG
jgi:transcriptional regulator with XRE-family HTH domain